MYMFCYQLNCVILLLLFSLFSGVATDKDEKRYMNEQKQWFYENLDYERQRYKQELLEWNADITWSPWMVKPTPPASTWEEHKQRRYTNWGYWGYLTDEQVWNLIPSVVCI